MTGMVMRPNDWLAGLLQQRLSSVNQYAGQPIQAEGGTTLPAWMTQADAQNFYNQQQSMVGGEGGSSFNPYRIQDGYLQQLQGQSEASNGTWTNLSRLITDLNYQKYKTANQALAGQFGRAGATYENADAIANYVNSTGGWGAYDIDPYAEFEKTMWGPYSSYDDFTRLGELSWESQGSSLLQDALDVVTPILMTAGVGLGVGGGLSALTGGAMGLGSAATGVNALAAGGAAEMGAGVGAASSGLTGLAAELAAGAPELAGTMGLSSAAGAGALSAELAAGAPELSGTMGMYEGAGLGAELAAGAPSMASGATNSLATELGASTVTPTTTAAGGSAAASGIGGIGNPNVIGQGPNADNWLQQFLQGQQSNVLGNLLGAGIGAWGSQQAAGDQRQLIQDIINSDLWRSQQPRYFEPLHQAATQGIGNTAYGQSIADATARKMASMGYNLSGNQMHEVAQGLNRGTVDYINAVQPLATGRPANTQAMAQVGQGAINSQQQAYGNIGYGLGQILNSAQRPGNNASNLWGLV